MFPKVQDLFNSVGHTSEQVQRVTPREINKELYPSHCLKPFSRNLSLTAAINSVTKAGSFNNLYPRFPPLTISFLGSAPSCALT